MLFPHRSHLLGLIAPLSLVGDPASATEARSPGSWSLQFRIDDNFTLDPFDGASIAVKRHFSGTTALRATVRIVAERFDADFSNESSSGGSTDSASDGNESRDVTSMSLGFLLLRHRTPDQTLTFLWGVGPRVQYTWHKSGNVENESDGVMQRMVDELTEWSAGLRGIAGVECSVVDWLAIHAEYGLDAAHYWTDTDRLAEQSTPTTPLQTFNASYDRTGWRVYGAGVQFGASVYF